MKKSCSTLAVLTHTVNLFLQLRSPVPLTHISGPGKPHIPHIYERGDQLSGLTVPENDDQHEQKDQTSTIGEGTREGPFLELRVITYGIGGTCGAHLVEDPDGEKGIFKSLDGEGGTHGTPLKRGVVYGEACSKETMAYLIGAEMDVPVTQGVFTTINGERVYGSLQKFVTHNFEAEDVGPSSFPLDEVQKIGILDIILLNLDRHLSNLLVVKEENGNKLVPIDHGYILPSFEDLSDVYFGWSYWKQCKAPWSVKAVKTVESLQPLTTAVLLNDLGLNNGSILASTLASLLLQHAVRTGVTLYQLASYLQSDLNLDEPSAFETAIKASLNAPGITDASDFDFSSTTHLPHTKWREVVDNLFLLATESFTTKDPSFPEAATETATEATIEADKVL